MGVMRNEVPTKCPKCGKWIVYFSSDPGVLKKCFADGCGYKMIIPSQTKVNVQPDEDIIVQRRDKAGKFVKRGK